MDATVQTTNPASGRPHLDFQSAAVRLIDELITATGNQTEAAFEIRRRTKWKVNASQLSRWRKGDDMKLSILQRLWDAATEILDEETLRTIQVEHPALTTVIPAKAKRKSPKPKSG